MSGQWPPEWEDQEEEFPGEADQLDPDAEARLSEVTAYLSSVPAPVLPDAIESRITAALAAEAAGRAASALADSATQADGATAADGARTVAPAPARARVGRRRGGGAPRLRSSRSLMAVGSLVVCLLLAGFGYFLSRGATETSSSTAAAGPAAGAGYAAGSSATVPAPVEPGFDETAPNFAVTESGTKYQAASLPEQVRARLAASGGAPSGSVPVPGPNSSSVTTSGGTDSGRASSPSAGLRGCVSRLTGGALPRLVDRATYQGEPAYIIASSSRVWVVGLGCTAADTELVASVPLAGLPGNLRALVSVEW
jgi:hypothetical protein